MARILRLSYAFTCNFAVNKAEPLQCGNGTDFWVLRNRRNAVYKTEIRGI